ncbi:Biotin-lipoyl like [Thermanaeromonas toyohensis ToBE]|uniref:Biotin-lipoyl like n=1 Tax=Thermanaeromonas toyohensis ToBE TaxID=698762 RepID=A0A1W1V9G9_9FIRM|nr:HlyD family secretion protein [Thermanaeromonas toyohensis]SMB89850.1 Biotin-lipoyl like [Thermanaeromonas toyohensis ToBE]
MKNKRVKVVFLVLILSLIGAGAIVGYYYYEWRNFVTTEDARVAADMVTVTPEVPGRLVQWNVKESDKVKAGQLLGRQDLEPSLTSTATGPQALAGAAGVMASKAEIRSPISGEIIQSKAVVGSLVSPGTPLAVVADTEHAYISANIKETEINRVKVGQKVEVRIDAYPGRVFSGRVASIGRATTSVFSLLPSQNSSGNYIKVTQVIPVKITLIDAGDIKLFPGMSSTVKIHVR